jgi:hypothetical protein
MPNSGALSDRWRYRDQDAETRAAELTGEARAVGDALFDRVAG